MKIKKLSDLTISRISAGEVVVGPAAVVKELVENSIDANATKIEIAVVDGGKDTITVIDDGDGIAKEDLILSLEQYATSKLPEEDIFNINYFGFRGEALNSIASVSRIKIVSKVAGAECAWSIEAEGGANQHIAPASGPKGTTVIVRDLFFATPARLKFLKSERAELNQITDIVKKIALANPSIEFILKSNNKTVFKAYAHLFDEEEAINSRINDVVSRDFLANATMIEAERDNITLRGFIGVPTYTRSTMLDQYLFVNKRVVKDKQISSAIKLAYNDYISRERFPVFVLFLDVPSEDIDVNVHPSKIEVRFRNLANLRGMLISSVKEALESCGHRASTTISSQAISSFRPSYQPNNTVNNDLFRYKAVDNFKNEIIRKLNDNETSEYRTITTAKTVTPMGANDQVKERKIETSEVEVKLDEAAIAPTPDNINVSNNNYLGYAKCQINKTYIIAQADDKIILVDQHAAHERLVYEKMKQAYFSQNIERQRLLIPEIVEMATRYIEILAEFKPELENFGILFDRFSPSSIVVNEIPYLLKDIDIARLVIDIAETIADKGEFVELKDKFEDILGTMSCHGSVRAGRELAIAEMNALLREMENNNFSGQCIHGRPTYIELMAKDIEKLFGRI